MRSSQKGAERGEGAKIVHIVEEAQLEDKIRNIFETARQHIIGVNYKPIAYVGSQIVKGVNHYFICQATPIYPNADPYAVLMCINQFQDQITIVSIEVINQ